MKRLIIIIFAITIITIFLLNPLWLYLMAKNKWGHPCMIDYVNKYYPEGSVYLINWKLPHIDKRWLWGEVKEINWCYINDSFFSLMTNTPYCYFTLFFEKVLTKLN